MIGAGSVVTKDVPDREVWIGNPARCIRKIDRGGYNCRVIFIKPSLNITVEGIA